MKHNTGTILIVALKRKGLSQKAFAELLGVSPSAVWKWVHNLCEPDQDKYQGIYDILGIDFWEIKINSTAKEESQKADNSEDRMIANRYIVILLASISLIFDVIYLATLRPYFAFLTWLLIASTSFFPFISKHGFKINFDSTVDTFAKGTVIAILGGITFIIVTFPIIEIIRLI